MKNVNKKLVALMALSTIGQVYAPEAPKAPKASEAPAPAPAPAPEAPEAPKQPSRWARAKEAASNAGAKAKAKANLAKEWLLDHANQAAESNLVVGGVAVTSMAVIVGVVNSKAWDKAEAAAVAKWKTRHTRRNFHNLSAAQQYRLTFAHLPRGMKVALGSALATLGISSATLAYRQVVAPATAKVEDLFNAKLQLNNAMVGLHSAQVRNVDLATSVLEQQVWAFNQALRAQQAAADQAQQAQQQAAARAQAEANARAQAAADQAQQLAAARAQYENANDQALAYLDLFMSRNTHLPCSTYAEASEFALRHSEEFKALNDARNDAYDRLKALSVQQ